MAATWTKALRRCSAAWAGRLHGSPPHAILSVALEQQRQDGPGLKMVGLVLRDRGVLRAHQKVYSDAGEGEITSGTFSPTLKQAVALARVPAGMGAECEVEIRGKRLRAQVVRYPFVRNGKPAIAI